MSVTDGQLVLAVLNGDKRAFSELYDRYARLIRVICNDTTGNYSQTQDLAQEVFLRAYTKLAKLEDPERFGPWLVSMTRNVCREFRRGMFRDRHVLVGLDPPEVEGKLDNKRESQQIAQLREALGKLSEKERLALHTYYLQDQDAEITRKLLGISRSSLYRLLAKAREKVEGIIEKEKREER